MLKKLMNVDETANLLGISNKTVYKYTSNKEIPFIKIGGRVLFDVNDLEIWIESKKQR